MNDYEELEHFFQTSQDLLCIANVEGSFLKINMAFENVLGYSKQEILAKSYFEFIHPDDIGITRNEVEKLKQGFKTVNFDIRFIKKDGTSLYIFWNVTPNSNGNIYAIGRYHYKIDKDSSHAKLEQSLQSIVNWQNAILDASQNCVIATHLDGTILYFNKTAEKLLEYNASELIGKHHPGIFHDSNEVIQRAKELSNELGRTVNPGFEVFTIKLLSDGFESKVWTYISKSGQRIPVQLNTSVVCENNKAIGFLGIARDIRSDLKRDFELQQTIRALNASAIVVVTSVDGKILSANENFIKLSEYSLDELVGKDHKILSSNTHSKDFFKKLWETILNGDNWEGEIQNKSKNGKNYYIHTVISPLKNALGQIDRFLGISFDVTAMKMAEKTKTDFLYTMSHEIRTPINGIIGMADLLSHTNLNPEQAEFCETINESSNILLTLINDTLDFSKLEAGKVELSEREFNLEEMLIQVIKLFQFNLEKSNLYIKLEVMNLNQNIIADDFKIRQIMMNLISNAMKFTKLGGITIKVLASDLNEKADITITVSDTGIGIPDKAKNRMFELFSQADQSTSRNFGGTGLGLAICKNLLKLMNGTIDFKSTQGLGTSFFINFSTKLGSKIVKAEMVKEKNQNKDKTLKIKGHILVAEDNKTNQLVISKYLEIFGLTYELAKNGYEVLDLLLKNTFDLILMDCQMPDMDGYMATEKIRSSGKVYSQIPIIALTANAVVGDEEKCRKVGMNDYLTKPINKKVLEAMLQKYIKPNESLIDLKAHDALLDLQIEGKPDIIAEMIDEYIKSSDEIISKIANCKIEKDLIDLSKLAHSLKSSSYVVGAVVLAEMSLELEKLKDSHNFDKAIDLVESIKSTYQKCRIELENIKNAR